jgi:glycosyltransferase involved in cell wall biosynthesis
MRLVVLTTSFPLTERSSAGIFVARLLDHLPSNIVATVITPAPQFDIVDRSRRATVVAFRYAPRSLRVLAQEPGGIPVALKTRKWTYLLLPGLLLSMFFSCLRAARQADLVYANWAICGAVAGLAARLLRVPVVCTLRGDDVTRAQRGILDRMILALCMRLCSRVVCVSDSISTWIRTRYPRFEYRVQVIENGVDDAFLDLPLRDHRTSDSPVRFLTVGSVIARKRIDRIILAMQRLPKELKIHLTVVGDGPERTRLLEIVNESKLNEQVEFLGAMPPSEIPALLARADVFVLASESEGRPNAVLEAMAAGLPVLASDIAGVNELVRHGITGFLFPPNATDQIAHLMHITAENADLRHRLGRAGRDAIFQRQLHWRATAEKYSALYDAVLNERHP